VIPDVSAVELLGGHRLRLRFDDGAEGVVDIAHLVSFTGVYLPLLDMAYFGRVRVEPDLGTICWPNGADIDPVMLYRAATGHEPSTNTQPHPRPSDPASPTMTDALDLRVPISDRAGEVSALLLRPAHARRLLVMGHGAGAGMRHAFMEETALALAARGIATFRYQFPYMERGDSRPDFQPVLRATVRAAVAAARAAAGDLPLLAGGKSMGGRMTSLAAAAETLPGVAGLVFFGFPLHPAGAPGTERARHLADVELPMLFLQGTRDKLAGLDLLRPIVDGLGARAVLRVVDGADHSFEVLKRSGRTHEAVIAELAETTAAWAEERTT